MRNMNNGIDTYAEVRVILTRTGELALALPIYANETGKFILNETETYELTDIKNISFACIVKLGYMVYHNNLNLGMPIFLNSLACFEDLGLLEN